MGVLFGLVVVVQTLLHYLGWLGVILGVVAFVFGNRERGVELLVGGLSMVAVKYVIGFVFLALSRLLGKRND